MITTFDMLTGETLEQAGHVPYLEQYFGTWAITPEAFNGHWNWFQKLDLHLHLQQHQAAAVAAAEEQRVYQVTKDNIAVIPIRGTLMKQVGSMSRNTSTVLAKRQIRLAMQDPEVAGLMLLVESPGGTLAGTKELADEIASASAGGKPLYAFVDDLCCSAAYWVASQAQKVFTNPTGVVGSIGTYMVVADYSGMAAKEGIKVHVIKAGEMKGAGITGTEVTPAQLSQWQELVNTQNEFFVRGVAQGRKLSLEKTRALADGRVHVGQAAVSLGLADGVQTWEATLSQLTSVSSRRKKAMSETTLAAVAEPLKPAAATVQQLRQSCKGADEKFLLSQLEAAATIEQAKDAWIAEQQQRTKVLQDELETTKTKKVGQQPLSAGKKRDESEDAECGDVSEQFNAAVVKAMGTKQGLEARRAAIQIVATRDPQLHQAYLLATNSSKKAQRQIVEKLEAFTA